MPTIPSGTKFMGVNPDVNTDEKRSSLSNSYQEFYTIDDIVAEASAADTNIYNSDGTLDANRTVDLDGNTLNLSGGNVGINQPTPTVPLHVKGTAIPSTNEPLVKLEVADATGSYLNLDNATLVDGEFVPQIIGRQNSGSTQSALHVSAAIDATQDAGTNPVTVFRSALASLTQVVTRPLFAFRNWSTTVMTILADGKVGIGTTAPATSLHVRSTAIPSAGEPVARFDVSDGAGYLQVANGTSTNGAFAPLIQGRQSGISTQPAFQTEGIIDVADDTGTTPVTIFKARLGTIAQVVTRPVFQFSNWTLDIMTILANGNVGIGTTTPTEKLEVSGKTKTTTFQMTTAPTAGYVLTSDASGNASWSAASGGLTKFTEAESTSAPNGTVYVDSLTAAASSTDADAAIVPKGAGALIAAVPNNLTSGGNKRGQYAVDWQMIRNANTRIASGNRSVIIGGYNNGATNTYSIVGGESNQSLGYASVVFGANNTANDTTGVALGNGNNVSGQSSVALGESNTIGSGRNYAFAAGGLNTISTTGGYQTALGYFNTVSNNVAVGIGYQNTASGSAAVALGQQNSVSGTNASALGHSNIANNQYSAAVGFNNTSSGIGSIALGSRNTASANGAAAIGGHTTYGGNTASGEASLAAGQASTASGYAAFAMGVNNVSDYYGTVATGLGAKTFGLYGRNSHSCGYIGTVGDSQKSTFTLGQRTTNNTPTTLISYYAAGTTPSAVNQVILSNQSAYRFKGTIIGKQSGSTNAAVWDIDGFIVRGANAAATTLNVSNVTLVQNTPAWGTPTLAADTTNGGLQVQVTGAAATNIQWTAVIETTEVIYA